MSSERQFREAEQKRNKIATKKIHNNTKKTKKQKYETIGIRTQECLKLLPSHNASAAQR
jgi:hypothetical protein